MLQVYRRRAMSSCKQVGEGQSQARRRRPASQAATGLQRTYCRQEEHWHIQARSTRSRGEEKQWYLTREGSRRHHGGRSRLRRLRPVATRMLHRCLLRSILERQIDGRVWEGLGHH